MWTIKPWRGNVYPQKTPQRLWPEYYGKQFNAIEFNATHYRIYSAEKMAAWAAVMPEDFRFCTKFPQIISHYRRFARCEGPTDDFIGGLLALGSKRGTTFIQLPPHYAPKHSENLLTYLEAWPREIELSIEFRHPDWFLGGNEAEVVWSRMSEWGIGAVISDTAGRRDALHMRLTASHVMVRFGGYEGHPFDVDRLQSWVRWIDQWKDRGVRSFDFLVHQPDSVHTPTTCRDFAEAVKAQTGIECRSPRLIETLGATPFFNDSTPINE